jgi:hypothetical protein
LWGTNTICDTSNPDKQSWIGKDCPSVYAGTGTPAPSPSVTPLQTLRNSGTKLEPAELDIGALTAPKAVTTQPTGLTGAANFTISMDLNIEKEPATWVDILQNVTGSTWPLDSNNRKPLIHLSGLGSGYTSRSVIMSLNNKPAAPYGWGDNNFWVDSAENNGWTFTPGTKFNFTATHDATTRNIAVYIDGVKKNEKNMGTAMVWAATNNFTWRPTTGGGAGYIKVNNAYFFKKVLTQAEITTLQGGASSGLSAPINLLTSETTFSQANPDVAATTQPTIFPTSNVVFTISMDMNIVAPSQNWREIFQNTINDSWNGAPVATGNTPLISIVPSTWSERANQVLFRMLLDNDTQFEAFSAAFVPGTYTKLTVVCNDTKITVYTNGQKGEEVTAPAGHRMKWRATNNFTWNPTSQYWIAGDTVKVKNGKWWNRALTDAEVTALGTSTYMPQPLSMGTSAYVKDDFASY